MPVHSAIAFEKNSVERCRGEERFQSAGLRHGETLFKECADFGSLFGVGQRVPETPRGGPLPAHAARGYRDIRDLARVLYRTAPVGSLVPFHGQPVPKPLALTMPEARAHSPR